jgi:hypothetical protein
MSNYFALNDEMRKYLNDGSEGSVATRVKYILAMMHSVLMDITKEEETNALRKTKGPSESQQEQSPEEQIHSSR